MKNSTIKPKLTKKCFYCGKEFNPYKSTDKYCSFQCAKLDGKINKNISKVVKIKQKSDKLKKNYSLYLKLRKEFLSKPENQICFIDGCNKHATTIEHTSGRIGKNLLDISTWKPCCWFHNLELESNPELSQKYQNSRFHSGKKIIK